MFEMVDGEDYGDIGGNIDIWSDVSSLEWVINVSLLEEVGSKSWEKSKINELLCYKCL